MQGDSFNQRRSLNMQLSKGMKDQLAYEKYKKEPINYQKIDAVEDLVDSQISLFTQQNDFQQQATRFYKFVKKNILSQKTSPLQGDDLAVSQDNDGVRLHFVYKQEENHRNLMIPQHESSTEQPIFEEKEYLFSQIHAEQMEKRTIHLFQRPQHQITSEEQKNLIPYLNSRNLTIGMLRRLLRDCIKTSLIYQPYLSQIDQECSHQNNCCQQQKDILGKIYEMQTQALNILYPQGKQSLLRQLLANNYYIVFNKSQCLKQKKQNDSKKQKP